MRNRFKVLSSNRFHNTFAPDWGAPKWSCAAEWLLSSPGNTGTVFSSSSVCVWVDICLFCLHILFTCTFWRLINYALANGGDSTANCCFMFTPRVFQSETIPSYLNANPSILSDRSVIHAVWLGEGGTFCWITQLMFFHLLKVCRFCWIQTSVRWTTKKHPRLFRRP